MSTITITDLTSADLGDEEAFNSRFATIVSKLNTGLATDNLNTGSVTRAKIGQGAIASANIDNTFTWTNAPYTAGWVDWPEPIHGGVQYYKDPRGIVRFRGLLTRSSGTSNVTMTLPVGYRPSNRLIFMLASGSGGTRMDVDPNGNVEWITGTAQNSWHSLCNISFRAVQ